jgi:outer membrane protein OmpA-like peptidoglycan-associated protein
MTDPYVAAKASLRDNVKTLIAVFGGIAGVLLAGTPFSGYGSLEPFSGRWVTASCALLVSLILLVVCIRKLLFVLRPDLTYTTLLTEETLNSEIRAVQAEFELQKHELLPKVHVDEATSRPIKSVTQLVDAKSAAWRQYQEDRTLIERKEAYDRLADALELINHWSGFTRLHVRVSRGIKTVFWIGLPAILTIAVFALAANSAKKVPTSLPAVYVVTSSSPVVSVVATSPMPVLRPILFATGKFDLTSEAVTRLSVARDYLRTHPNAGVLIFANTDTVGGEAVNHSLARRRAERIADLLRSEGGISPSRIFVTPLAKQDLPALTTQMTESEANRSVEMILIPMPVRGG